MTTRIMLEIYTSRRPLAFLAVSRDGVWVPVSMNMHTDAIPAHVACHFPTAAPIGDANDNEAASAFETFSTAGGVGRAWMVEEGPMVVLSSPLGFPGAIIEFAEIDFPANLAGSLSYVGHPATRQLLDALGVEYVSGRWAGPAVGESYLAVPLAQNMREGGYTNHAVIESISALRAVRCTRLA